MIYIFCAIRSEAQAIVESYKLQKITHDEGSYYSNESMKVYVCGVGIQNMYSGVKNTLATQDLESGDSFFNVGICGASREYKIGECINIGNVEYMGVVFKYKTKNKTLLTCVDTPVDYEKYSLVDMESYGFYRAMMELSLLKNSSIHKVVSDHFEPTKVSKDRTKKLLQACMDEIFGELKK